MAEISDMIKQLEEKASKYDELISDIGELLSKYTVSATNDSKEEVTQETDIWLEIFENCERWDLEGRGGNWVWKNDLLTEFGKRMHYSSRGTVNSKFNDSAKDYFSTTRHGVKVLVRPKGYNYYNHNESYGVSEVKKTKKRLVNSRKEKRFLDAIVFGKVIDIKPKYPKSKLFTERVQRIISYYEIPLSVANKIARYSEWEMIAQDWCQAEVDGKILPHRYENSNTKNKTNDAFEKILSDKQFFYVFGCNQSSELRGKRTKNKHKPCGLWQVRKSNTKLTGKRQIQGNCKCGRRPRLSVANTKLYFSLEAALLKVEKLNRKEKVNIW
jgi:hypothetical protein